jgi:tRNA A37 methylthiotransferase MiaB
MARGYTVRDFQEVIVGFRRAFPEISITTDIIVGFPGETEEDFSETCTLIKEASPDKVNVTKFSRRPGTPAFDLYDMPDRIKKERSRKATKLWMDIASRRNRAYQGRILEALVTERGRDGTVKARSRNYMGLVIASPWKLGSVLDVRVESSNPFYLTARALVENHDDKWGVNRVGFYI